MRNIASVLGRDADAEQCRRDAELLADVIDGRMWDEASGLYGWLCRTETGVERPLVGGCCGDRSAVARLPRVSPRMTCDEAERLGVIDFCVMGKWKG